NRLVSLINRFIYRQRKRLRLQEKASPTLADMPSVTFEQQNFEESMVEVGTALSVVDNVVEAAKATDIPPVGFALIRPRGSDEECCNFNTLAIAARYVQRVHGLKRVFIIDFDIDYGTQTSDTFYDDGHVLYLSTHELQSGSAPAEGFPTGCAGIIENIGKGDGEGTTINVELPDLTGDVAMRNVFNEVILPAVKKFEPDIILVSAGYNGHVLDEDYRFQMTTGGYYRLASKIKGLARIACGGRCVFFLDEGYCRIQLAQLTDVNKIMQKCSNGNSFRYSFSLKFCWVRLFNHACEVGDGIWAVDTGECVAGGGLDAGFSLGVGGGP
ncbi:histone deacetylase 14, partial [Tanacetum coccineum]